MGEVALTHSARETLKRIGDLVEVAVKMTVQLGEDSDLHLRGLMSALDNVYQAIDDIDTEPVMHITEIVDNDGTVLRREIESFRIIETDHTPRLYGVKQMRKESHASS